MLEGITTIAESNHLSLSLLFGYTNEEIDTIVDKVEIWATNACFGC